MCKIFFNIVFRQKYSFCLYQSLFQNYLSSNKRAYFSVNNRNIMKLSSVIRVFEKHVPKYLAEKWDNTGLLIEPEKELSISTILFTNDLTEDVLEEALAARANLIISYHPPLFKPMKSFLSENWKDRVAMKCILNSIAVYSPHTACDAVKGGVNDWLIKCFDLADQKPVIPSGDLFYSVLCVVASEANLAQALDAHVDYKVVSRNQHEDKLCLKVMFHEESQQGILSLLSMHPEIEVLTIQDCTYPKRIAQTGMGRIGKLKNPLKLADCIQKMKKYVGLDHLRVTLGMNKTLDSEISTIAVCAGSGSSVLSNVSADLFITGEMSHHDLLDVRHKGSCAILCEHSNSERGYLQHLVNQLRSDLKGVHLIVSSIDKDPVSII